MIKVLTASVRFKVHAPFQRVGIFVDLQNVGTNRSLYFESDDYKPFGRCQRRQASVRSHHTGRLFAVNQRIQIENGAASALAVQITKNYQ